MTPQHEVRENENYITLHNHGFVGYVDHMGSDDSIVQAARVSYGKGIKKRSEDKALIRYLIRHRHTTPLEMVEVKFHIKLPIFAMRQLIRHRTANVNEYSARYSEMSDNFYIPDDDFLRGQSQTNKQGTAGEINSRAHEIQMRMQNHNMNAYEFYDYLMNGESENKDIYPVDHEGISRELARMVLPVSNYTEAYWKMDLHNLFHFLKLRLDPHAQREIREYAEAMYSLIKPLFPVACEAFEDYIRESKTFSRMELNILRDLIKQSDLDGIDLVEKYGLSKRESNEFYAFFEEDKTEE